MTNLLHDVREEANKIDPSAYIVLFILTQTNPTPGFRPAQYHFTSTTTLARTTDGELTTVQTPIIFAGDVYEALPIEAEGFELKSGGSLPTPKIRVAIGPLPAESQRELNNLLGWNLTRIRTFARFLDNEPEANPLAILSTDTYRVERKTGQTSQQIEWELQSALDQEGVVLPRRQITKHKCTHTYRVWDETSKSFNLKGVTCPYRGLVKSVAPQGGPDGQGGVGVEKGYDESNRPVANEADDVCGRTIRSCKIRFGRGVSLPTTAFPGVKNS